MGMHGYMSFHVCGSWKITFSSRFFPFMLLNQGLYCTMSLEPFSLNDYILLFFISLFSIYFVIVIFTFWSCFFSLLFTFPPSRPTLIHLSSFSLHWIPTSHGISSYSGILMAYQGSSPPTKAGRGSPKGGNGSKSSQESHRQALLLLLWVPQENQAIQL